MPRTAAVTAAVPAAVTAVVVPRTAAVPAAVVPRTAAVPAAVPAGVVPRTAAVPAGVVPRTAAVPAAVPAALRQLHHKRLQARHAVLHLGVHQRLLAALPHQLAQHVVKQRLRWHGLGRVHSVRGSARRGQNGLGSRNSHTALRAHTLGAAAVELGADPAVGATAQVVARTVLLKVEPKHVVGLALPQRSQAAPDKLSRGKLAHQRGAVLHRQRHHKHDVGVLHHGKAAQHAAPLEANVLVLGAVRRHLAHARHADNLLPIRGNHIVVRVPRRDEGHHIVNQVLLPALPGRLQRHPLDKVAVDGLELRLKVLLDRRGGPHAPPNVAHHSQGGGVLELERHKAPGKRPHVLRSGRTRIVHWRGPHAVGAGAGRIPRGRGRLVRGRGWLVRGKGWLVRGRGWLVRSRGLVLRSRGPVLRSRGRLVHSRASSQIVQRALVHPPLHRHPVVAPRLHAKPRHKLGTRLHPHASQDPPSPILEAAARIQRVLALPSKHLHTAQLTEALERARLHAGSGFDAVPPQTAARHAGKGQAGMGDALVNRVHHGKVELVPQRPSIHGDGTRIAARPRGGAQVLDELHNHLSRAILGKKPLRIVVAHGNVEGGPQSLHLASVARESLGNLLADPLHLDIQGIQRAVQVVVLAQQETHFARQQVVGPGKPVVAKFLVRLAVLKELEHLLPHLLLASADFVVLSLPLQSANLKKNKKNNPKKNKQNK